MKPGEGGSPPCPPLSVGAERQDLVTSPTPSPGSVHPPLD